MPQFDFTSFPSQIFWVLVTFALLYVIMSRMALPRVSEILEERQDRIDNDMDKAIELRAEAEKIMEQYNIALAEARTKSRDLMESAHAEMQHTAMEKHTELSAKLATDTAKAEQKIETAKAKAMENVKGVAMEISQQVYEKLTGVKASSKQATTAIDKVTNNKKAA